MFYDTAIFESIISDRSHTEKVSFPTKQYVQACFQVVLSGKTLRNKGTGGGHSGNAGLTYQHDLKSTSANASATDVRDLLLYPNMSELLKGTGISTKGFTGYFIRFPNLQMYRKDDNGKLKTQYYLNNPYYSDKMNNKSFQKIFNKFTDLSIISDASDKEAIQCYIPVTKEAMKLADKFIGTINSSKIDKENIDEWKRIIKEKYIQGADCESIELAVDWYVSVNGTEVEKYSSMSSLGDDMAYGVDDTNELFGANPNISFSANTLLNNLPTGARESASKDISHTYTLPIRSDYSLLFLGSFSIERTNDSKVSNIGINTHYRSYIFTVINPDSEGNYTQFPGKVQLVYTIDNVDSLNSLRPGYVYELKLNNDDKKELFRSNLGESGSIQSKLVGETGAGMSAIEFPNEPIQRVSNNGIEPEFTNKSATSSGNPSNVIKKTSNKEPKDVINKSLGNIPENLPINKDFLKKDDEDGEEVSPKLESSFLWFPGWDWKD